VSSKLLLDQNLSRRLVAELLDHFPGTTHVTEVKLALASDKEVWEYAQKTIFVLSPRMPTFII
jgi:predicted nuclease of predicted toxin-antitoxin system